MKILVIGGDGFLGSHVFQKLQNKFKKNVFVLDLKNKNKINDNNFIKGDISDLKSLISKLKKFDLVYHFAGLSDLDEAYKDPIKAVKLNLLGTLNVLEACKINKIKKIVFASTMYVSGSHGSFYKCSKTSCEDFIKEYKKRYNLNYTILRYGSLYGPRSDEKNGLYRIIKKIIDSKKIYFEGDVEAVREYIHVQDAAKASIEILNKRFENISINITGQQSITMMNLLKILKEILSIKKPIKVVKKRRRGHYSYVPNNYNDDLSIKFTSNTYIDFAEGVTNLIKNIKKNIK